LHVSLNTLGLIEQVKALPVEELKAARLF